MTGKPFIIFPGFPGFPGAVGTLTDRLSHVKGKVNTNSKI